MKTAAFVPFPFFNLVRRDGVSLSSQIYHVLQQRILSGVLKPGGRVPTSRELATTLKVSRGLIIRCYEKLIAEAKKMK